MPCMLLGKTDLKYNTSFKIKGCGTGSMLMESKDSILSSSQFPTWGMGVLLKIRQSLCV